MEGTEVKFHSFHASARRDIRQLSINYCRINNELRGSYFCVGE